MRAFVGIELDAATRVALADAGAAIRAADPGWAGEKWVRPENLHVTLAFLGDIEDGLVDELTDTIGSRLSDIRAFTLPFLTLQAIPSARRASMLWAAYADSDGQAQTLERLVSAACRSHGITLQERPFRAHVTVVRARRPHRVSNETAAALHDLAASVPAFVSVPSATLFSSTLTKAGPVYRPRATWPFSTRNASS